jgi:hypothetical protein
MNKFFEWTHLVFVTLSCAFGTKAWANSPDPKVVMEIADHLDRLVGDTVDEGSWNADVIRNAAGIPSEFICNVTDSSRDTQNYRCDFSFSVTPYEGEDLGESWKVTCSDVIFNVRLNRNGRITLTENELSIQSCLENLSESP